MFTSGKRLVKSGFSAFGLDIHKKRPEQPVTLHRASLSGALRQLSALGFKPKTVIDVGVATQTSELYEEFKDCNLLLIEPLVEFEPFLRKICGSYKAQYVLAAAGEVPGSATINVHPDKFGSSMLKEVEGALVDGTPREVPVVTIDRVCSERNLEGPYLIKVDVQGAELHVLCGATSTLLETEAVILEVTLFGTMIGGPQLFDIVHWMKNAGFVVYDIWGFSYRPLDNALAQVDLAFVREAGAFRQYHGYATPDWRKERIQSLEPFLAQLGKQP
jgi:FkbM family methyltransferase